MAPATGLKYRRCSVVVRVLHPPYSRRRGGACDRAVAASCFPATCFARSKSTSPQPCHGRTFLSPPDCSTSVLAGRAATGRRRQEGSARISQNGAVLRFIYSGGDRWPDDITARDAPPTSSHHDAGCACETDSLDSVRYVPTSRLKRYPLAASATNNDGTTGRHAGPWVPLRTHPAGPACQIVEAVPVATAGCLSSCHSWLPEHAPQER